MICKAKYKSNWAEIEQAEKLGTTPPEPIIIYDDVIFNPRNIEAVDKTDNGEIRVWLISGQQFTVKYTDDLWGDFITTLDDSFYEI